MGACAAWGVLIKWETGRAKSRIKELQIISVDFVINYNVI